MYYKGDGVHLVLGDFREVIPKLRSNVGFDAVITDPPYLKEYRSLYWELAGIIKPRLRRGGHYMAILPKFSVPRILENVGKHLVWHWALCMWQPGPNRSQIRQTDVWWKQIGWWTNGRPPNLPDGKIRDGFTSKADKQYHPWQQPLEWASFCLERVLPGGWISDPMMGPGTVGVACVREGYPFVGVEKDPDTFATAVRRIRGEGTELERVQ